MKRFLALLIFAQIATAPAWAAIEGVDVNSQEKGEAALAACIDALKRSGGNVADVAAGKWKAPPMASVPSVTVPELWLLFAQIEGVCKLIAPKQSN